jgi:hypothetical protein
MVETYREKWSEPVKWISKDQYIVVDDEYYRVTNIDTLDVVIPVTLAAGAQTTLGSLTQVDPEEGILYAFLIGVRGPAKFSINQPSAVQKWGVRTASRGYLSYLDSPYRDPDPRTFTVTLRARTIDLIVQNLDMLNSQTFQFRLQGYKYELGPVPKDKLELVKDLHKQGRLPAVYTRGISKALG